MLTVRCQSRRAARALGIGVVAAMTCSPLASGHIISEYNLIVTGNMNVSADVEGRMFVGGNLTGSSATLAKNLTPASSYIGVDTVLVGGNVTSGTINLQAGNLKYGGTLSAGINFNGGGSGVQSATQSPALAGLGAQYAAQLAGVSQLFRGLSPTGTVSLPNSPGPVNFSAVPQGPDAVAIFEVDGVALFQSGNTQQIDIALNGAGTVIINVSGTSINWTGGNFVGNFTSPQARSRVIWNFYEATSLTFGPGLNGALLAPDAAVSLASSNEGSVFVRQINAAGEIHLPLYQGVVPAPGAGAALLGAGLLVARRRR